MSIGCTQRPQCTSEPTRPPVFLCLLSRSVPVNFRALHGPDPSRKCLFCAAPAWAGAPPILCSRLTLQVSARRQQACLKFCHRTTLSPWPQMRITWPTYSPSGASLRPPWTAARQAPLSMVFSRQGYWSGLSFPPPGSLPDPGIEPVSSAWAGGSPSPNQCVSGAPHRELSLKKRTDRSIRPNLYFHY